MQIVLGNHIQALKFEKLNQNSSTSLLKIDKLIKLSLNWFCSQDVDAVWVNNNDAKNNNHQTMTIVRLERTVIMPYYYYYNY